MTPEQLARYVCDPDGISMTAFARGLIALKDEGDPGELTGRQLSDRLLSEGYLIEQSADISAIMSRIEGWEKQEHSARRGPYGLQRIYERKKQEDLTGTQLSLKCD